MSERSAFLDRYARAFGGPQAMLLRMAGLTEAEVSGEGCWITDASGRRWQDFGSFGLHLLGHCHPDVVAACRDQIGRMGQSTRILGNALATQCAARLMASLGCRADGVLFANSGAEANEIALKIARLATGRHRVLALNRSYHGKTAATLAVSDTLASKAQSGAPGGFFAAENPAALDNALAQGDVAAVMVEPVQGEGGIRAIAPDDLARIAAQTHASGALLIVDEIQSGMGRTGPLWAADHAALSPDIVTAGKGLGGGVMPVAAAIYSKAKLSSGAVDPVLHASTFAGSPIAARAALAALDVLGRPDMAERIAALGRRALDILHTGLKDSHIVRDIRGAGLMIGVECTEPSIAADIVLETAKRGVLVSFCLSHPCVIRIYPPAVTSDADLDLGLAGLIDAARTVAGQSESIPVTVNQ